MKKMFTSVLLLMSILNVWAETNDCSTPISTQQSNERIVYTSPNIAYEFVWYEFEAKTTNVQIESDNNFELYILSECNSNTSIRFDKNEISNDSLSVKFYLKNLTIGQKYLLQIYKSVKFKFAISEFEPISNDECVDANLLEQTVNINPTVQDISKSTTSNNSNYKDVWYRFVAKSNHVMISVALNGYNTYLKMYKSCDSLSKPITNTYGYRYLNNNGSLNINYKFNDLIIGNEYVFKVESQIIFSPLSISIIGFQPEINDECVGAKPIKVDTIETKYSQSLFNATGYDNSSDLWYELELTAPVLIVDENVQLFEKCNGNEILHKQIGMFDSLDVNKKYLMKVVEGNYSDSLYFKIYNINYLKNDNCSGAETITPADTFVPHIVDLSQALPSNVPYPHVFGSYGNEPDLWYKFIATSKSMTVKAYQEEFSYEYALALALYDQCNGNLIDFTYANSGNNKSQVQIIANNLEIGKQYYYRLIKISGWQILVRLGQTSSVPKDKVVHGVISNNIILNDSIKNAHELCQHELFSANTADYKVGREVGIIGSSCNTGIEDAKTKEMFFAFCKENIGELSIKSNNKNLIVKAEIFEKLNDNSFRQIGCSNLYYSSENSYSFFFNKDYIPHNVFIRVEMSDTSKVLSDYDFGFVVKPIVYGAVEDKHLNATFEVYPNPATDQITVKFENPSNSNLEIYDKVGKLVHSQVLTNELTNINLNLPSGIYIAKVKNDLSSKSIKLIIQ